VETIGIVLSIRTAQAGAFEAGFRQQELPVWQDLEARGLLRQATLSRLDISTSPVEGATQYLVVAIFHSGEGHHAHDDHPGFKAWNEIADAYQVAPAIVFGGETVVRQPD
jgi:hypothetical protein